MRQWACVLTWLLLASPAAADSASQVNVLNHVAQASVAERLCPTLSANSALMVATLLYNGVDITRPRDEARFKARLEHYMRELQPLRRDTFCASARFLYGPNGQNVPGLLR